MIVMLFTTIEQFAVLGMLLLGGLLLGYAIAPSPKKWKRRVREQSDSFTASYAEAEERARAANLRAGELKTELDALRAEHADAQRTIAELRAAAAIAPIAAVAAEAEAERTPPRAVETAPVRDPESALEVIEEHPTAEVVSKQEPVAEAPVVAEPLQEPAAPVVEEAVFEPVAAPSMTPTATDAPPAPIGPAEPEMPAKGWFASSARDELTRIRGIDVPLNTRLFGLGVTRFEDLEKLSAEDEMALEQRLALPVGTIARDQWRTQAALLRAGQDDEHATHFAPTAPVPVA